MAQTVHEVDWLAELPSRADRIIFPRYFSVLLMQSWPHFGRIFLHHCELAGSWGQVGYNKLQRKPLPCLPIEEESFSFIEVTANVTQYLPDSDWVTCQFLNQSLWARIWGSQKPLSQLGSIPEVWGQGENPFGTFLTNSGRRVDFLKCS